jgi:hypothetical protein
MSNDLEAIVTKTTQENEYSTVLSNHNLASYNVIQPGAVDKFKSFFA